MICDITNGPKVSIWDFFNEVEGTDVIFNVVIILFFCKNHVRDIRGFFLYVFNTCVEGRLNVFELIQTIFQWL